MLLIAQLNNIVNEYKSDNNEISRILCVYNYVEEINKNEFLKPYIDKWSVEAKEQISNKNEPIFDSLEKLQINQLDSSGKIKSYAYLYYYTLKLYHDFSDIFREIINTNSTKPFKAGLDNFSIDIERINKIELSDQIPKIANEIIEKIFLEFHNHVISIVKANEFIKKGETKFKLFYDIENCILHINDHVIQINPRGDKPDAHYLLEHIFRNDVKEVYDFSEIIQTVFKRDFEKNPGKKAYDACVNIQKK